MLVGLFDEGVVHSLFGEVDGHVVIQELQGVVHQGAHRCLSLDTLTDRFLAVFKIESKSPISS